MGEAEPIFIILSFKKLALGFGVRKFGCWNIYLSLLFLTIDIEFRKPRDVGYIKWQILED